MADETSKTGEIVANQVVEKTNTVAVESPNGQVPNKNHVVYAQPSQGQYLAQIQHLELDSGQASSSRTPPKPRKPRMTKAEKLAAEQETQRRQIDQLTQFLYWRNMHFRLYNNSLIVAQSDNEEVAANFQKNLAALRYVPSGDSFPQNGPGMMMPNMGMYGMNPSLPRMIMPNLEHPGSVIGIKVPNSSSGAGFLPSAQASNSNSEAAGVVTPNLELYGLNSSSPWVSNGSGAPEMVMPNFELFKSFFEAQSSSSRPESQMLDPSNLLSNMDGSSYASQSFDPATILPNLGINSTSYSSNMSPKSSNSRSKPQKLNPATSNRRRSSSSYQSDPRPKNKRSCPKNKVLDPETSMSSLSISSTSSSPQVSRIQLLDPATFLPSLGCSSTSYSSKNPETSVMLTPNSHRSETPSPRFFYEEVHVYRAISSSSSTSPGVMFGNKKFEILRRSHNRIKILATTTAIALKNEVAVELRNVSAYFRTSPRPPIHQPFSATFLPTPRFFPTTPIFKKDVDLATILDIDLSMFFAWIEQEKTGYFTDRELRQYLWFMSIYEAPVYKEVQEMIEKKEEQKEWMNKVPPLASFFCMAASRSFIDAWRYAKDSMRICGEVPDDTEDWLLEKHIDEPPGTRRPSTDVTMKPPRTWKSEAVLSRRYLATAPTPSVVKTPLAPISEYIPPNQEQLRGRPLKLDLCHENFKSSIHYSQLYDSNLNSPHVIVREPVLARERVYYTAAGQAPTNCVLSDFKPIVTSRLWPKM
ncbi:unnamed protein product [Caenorhabditis auriculariae]|uniref:Uncharacterized protein n=1 Tax=Caenorhabditis auriculariae TaxID=2777116 RepID=A0A8S1HR63_9PELO|nr:unnamed protein product [Caenorhabditis auriculariae]